MIAAKTRVRVRAQADGTVLSRKLVAGDPSISFIRTGGRRDAARSDIPELEGWSPRPGFGGSNSYGESEAILGRAQDLDKNNAWINGGLDRRVESVIGDDIRLSSQPVIELFGPSYDFKWRMKWVSNVQARYRVWGSDIERRCDARQILSFGQIVRLAYLLYIRDGEAAAEIRDTDRGLTNPSNVMLFAAERISTPRDRAMPEGPTLRNGVAMNDNGAPIGYWIRSRHPADPTPGAGRDRWEFVPRFGSTGRHKLLHVFSPRFAEQNRGISRLAEAMVPAKMLDRVDRAEVQAALKAAIMSFFIKSPGTTDDIEGMLAPTDDAELDPWVDQYLDYRENKPVKLDAAQVVHLLPDEDVLAPDPTRPNSNYPTFVRWVLQKIAASLGISYPALSQDWSGINYSSARALLNELWRSFLQDRAYFTQAFCTPVYAAWLEREVANGDVKVPGGPANFYRQKTAICMASWIGPGRGSVDPLKEANANNLDTAAGRKSTPQLILEDGHDPSDTLAEQVWWLEECATRGLLEPNYNVKAAAEAADAAAAEDDAAERAAPAKEAA